MSGFAYFLHLFHTGGLVMYPLLLLSLFTVAIAVERFFYYKKNRKGSKLFCKGINSAVKHQQWDAAQEYCAKYDTAMSRIVLNGLKHSDSDKDMRDAFQEQLMVESVNFRRYLDYLSATVTISPLLGLLGTVTGMIGTFSILDSGAGASSITGGIGEALVATATGLCVAIIAFIVYTFFDHQLDTIITDTEQVCVDVLNARKAK